MFCMASPATRAQWSGGFVISATHHENRIGSSDPFRLCLLRTVSGFASTNASISDPTTWRRRSAHATIVISGLHKHHGFAPVLLTAALILVTGYYAFQNRRMVGEMRRAREVAVMPKLAIEFAFFGPMNVNVAIKNIGPGVALDVDV